MVFKYSTIDNQFQIDDLLVRLDENGDGDEFLAGHEVEIEDHELKHVEQLALLRGKQQKV